jgi:drug/metabolite transporter (DMT)-like permease
MKGRGYLSTDKSDPYGMNGDIAKDYDTILKESAVLTTVSGFLFAFLLNISVNRPSEFSFEDGIILMIALFTITFATSFLSMPVFYHHLQFPYRDIDRFRRRSHRFMMFGTVPLFVTLYLGLLLGLKFGLHQAFESEPIEYWAYIFAAIPFISIYVFYRLRK